MDTTDQNQPHRRLSHLVASLFVLSLFILGWVSLIYGMEVYLLLFAGILFGVFLRSISVWVSDKFPISKRWAVLVTTLVLLLTVGGTGWALVPSLSKQMKQLGEALPQAVEKLQQSISQYGIGRSVLAKAPNPEQIVTQNGNMARTVADAFRVTTKVVANTVAIFFLGLFFAVSPELYTRGVIALTPKKHEARAREVIQELYITLSRWLQGQLLAMAVVAVLTTLGLWALGVKLALVLGLLAGLLAFIPNLGPVISAVPAVMVALLESPTQALYIVLLYIVVQTIESYLITPLIQKKMVRLPPALVLFVQFLMGVALGTFALALATPLAAAGLVLVKMLYVDDVLGKCTRLPGDNKDSDKEADQQH